MNGGVNLKELRKQLALSQEDVAKIMGVKREMISYYENGKREISVTTLQKLLDFAGINLEDFESGSYEKKVQVAYRKEKASEQYFEEVIWLNKFVKNLSYLKKLNRNEEE